MGVGKQIAERNEYLGEDPITEEEKLEVYEDEERERVSKPRNFVVMINREEELGLGSHDLNMLVLDQIYYDFNQDQFRKYIRDWARKKRERGNGNSII